MHEAMPKTDKRRNDFDQHSKKKTCCDKKRERETAKRSSLKKSSHMSFEKLRIPTVPLQQYEELVSVTERLMSALRSIAELNPASPAAIEAAVLMARAALRSVEADDDSSATATCPSATATTTTALVPSNYNFSNTDSTNKQTQRQPQLSSSVSPPAATTAAPLLLGRSASAPIPQPAINNHNALAVVPTLAAAADNQHQQRSSSALVSPQRRAITGPGSTHSSIAAASNANNNNNNANNANNKQRLRTQHQPSAAAPAPGAATPTATLAEGAVGSGVGGTSATVRENIVEGGKLVKLVSDAHPLPGKLWSLQNTTTNTQFIVTFTFGAHSQVVEPLGDTTVITKRISMNKASGGGGGGERAGGVQAHYRISLYPLETKPFVRGVFSGYRMSLRFGPPDSGYVAAVRTTGGAVQSVLERLDDIRRTEYGGFLPLNRALSTCLDAGSSFVDVEFPPTQESVCRSEFETEPAVPPAQLKWERPERFLPLGEKSCLAAGFDAQSLMWTLPSPAVMVLVTTNSSNNNSASMTATTAIAPLNNATLRKNGASVVFSSVLRTMWLVSAAAVLASNPTTVRLVLAALRRCTLGDSTAGLFRVELCSGGIWRNVVVDSLLPCMAETPGRECVAARCAADKRDMWGAVVEKAFAKCCGSYSAIMSPTSSASSNNNNNCNNTVHDPLDAMLDLTGGVVERLDWRAREVGVFAALQAALLRDSHRSYGEFALVAMLLSNAAAVVPAATSRRSASAMRIEDSSQAQQPDASPKGPQQELTHLEKLGFLPGAAYRVVTTATADNRRLVLIDDIYNIEAVPRASHIALLSESGAAGGRNRSISSFNSSNVEGDGLQQKQQQQNQEQPSSPSGSVGGGGDPLPLRGAGIWSDERQWQEHPNVAEACRAALQPVLASAARPRKQWSTLEMALLTQRLVWLDWRDAVCAFDGAGTLLVPPEMSLVPAAGGACAAAASRGPSPSSESTHNAVVAAARAGSTESIRSHNASPSARASSVASAVSASSAGASAAAAGYSSVPRQLSHMTTLDLRFPNAFTAASPDWMLQLTVRGDRPVTIYAGLHQRDRRGLDPLHKDRHYSALLLSCIGQSAASGVFDVVANSHNGTYWRGRDVQVELVLEPRAKPYYILPRRYASATDTLPSVATGGPSSYQQHQRNFQQQLLQQQLQQQQPSQQPLKNEHRKDIVLSLQVPDGLARLRPSDFVFRRPTAEAMRAVRYSPVWRFDPDSCQTVELTEYCASLQKKKTSTSSSSDDEEKEKDASTSNNNASIGENKKTEQPHHHTNATAANADGMSKEIVDVAEIERPEDRVHHFFRVVRQSRSVDTHNPHHLQQQLVVAAAADNHQTPAAAVLGGPATNAAIRTSRLDGGGSRTSASSSLPTSLSTEEQRKKLLLQINKTFDPEKIESTTVIVNRVPQNKLVW